MPGDHRKVRLGDQTTVEASDIGAVICSGSMSMRKPRGGRLLMIVKMIPRACRSATTAWARAVNRFSSVIKVPSTSETTAEIFADGIRDNAVMTIFQHPSH
jgi:hypothetical protein